MLQSFELLLGSYPNTIAAFSAISTFLAVLVSLAIALVSLKQNETRLQAYLSTSVIIHETIDPSNRPRYLTASITNVGNMPLRIGFSFFNWKIPFYRWNMMVNPLDHFGVDVFVPRVTYPLEIAPRASHTAFISSVDTFRDEIAYAKSDAGAIWGFMFRFIRPVIFSADGRKFRVKVSKELKKTLRRIEPKKRSAS